MDKGKIFERLVMSIHNQAFENFSSVHFTENQSIFELV